MIERFLNSDLEENKALKQMLMQLREENERLNYIDRQTIKQRR